MLSEKWQIAVATVCGTFFSIWLIYKLLLAWATKAYKQLIANNTVDVDEFVKSPPDAQSCLKVVTLHKFNTLGFKPSKSTVPLKTIDSDKVDGLKVTQRAPEESELNSDTPPLVVGTIRMGFGHHRIAYATTSWGLDADSGRDTYFHDLLNVESPEGNMIHEVDKKYSKGSRMASEIGGIVEGKAVQKINGRIAFYFYSTWKGKSRIFRSLIIHYCFFCNSSNVG